MDDRALAASMVLWMEKHLTGGGNGRELERVSGYSENRLREKFFSVTGETPSGYLRKRRLSEAAKRLLAGDALVDVAAEYGYSSQENFTTAFKSWFGITPGELRTTDRRYRFFLNRIKEPMNIMELANLKQGPLNTTFIGCMKGASEYWELDWTIPELFGYSAFGFMLNIHRDLCPSGPYCWNKDRVFLNLRDMGIRRIDCVKIDKFSSAEERERMEKRIRSHLDAEKLVMVDYLEHQLISGYDTDGFTFLRPWNCDDASTSEIKQLSFGTWKEALEKEGWIWFTFLEKETLCSDRARLLRGAIDTAREIRNNPKRFACEGYYVGDEAWEAWIAANDKGLGSSHGNWWNGMVWSECRVMTADFFAGLKAQADSSAVQRLYGGAEAACRAAGAAIAAAASKDSAIDERGVSLKAGRAADAACEKVLKELNAVL